MAQLRQETGFTLVELMVVVLIIGILVAVAIPVFQYAGARVRRNACQANLRTLDGIAAQWSAESVDNDRGTLDGDATTALIETALGEYVRDWEKSTTCPADSTERYSVVDGDFTCDYAADHNYEK